MNMNRAFAVIGVALAVLPAPGLLHAHGPPARQTADTPSVRLDRNGVERRLAGGTAEAPDLSHTDLSGLDLTGLDFRRASLTGARLANAKLAGANRFSCDLTDAVLAGANLTVANLDGT